MSKGEFKERMEKEHLRLIGSGKPVDPNQYAQFIHSMLDEARKDLMSEVCDCCWFSEESLCKNEELKMEQPDDCFKVKLEKWLGGESK